MRLLTLVICLLPLLAHTQPWCPPGATWTFGLDAFGSYGFEQYTYAGDTLLGGVSGQRIDLRVGMSSYLNDQQDFNVVPASLITGLQNDVVMQWSNTYQSWDTLFWLGADPGHVFHRPFANTDECDPLDIFVVSDTATIVLDGLPLRRWTIDRYWDGIAYGALQFTERIGWEWSMLPFPVCMAVDGPAGLRCYSDGEINASFFPFGCTTLVGMDETLQRRTIHGFPDPGKQEVTIQLPVGTHHIALFDALGRAVFQRTVTAQLPAISTTDLPVGTYFIQVSDGEGTIRKGSWVKAP